MFHGIKLTRSLGECFISCKISLPQAFGKHNASTSDQSKPKKQHQKLPRLPVPSLKDTLTKYLDTARPFCSEKEFAECVNLVEDFEKNWAPKIQEILLKRFKEHTNWLSEWWLNYAYLDSRNPLIVHSSVGVYLPVQHFESPYDQYKFLAKMLIATLDYKYLIDNNKLPQEKMGKFLLDMEQYKKVFGTCRLPEAKRDRQTFNDKSTYIIVMHNNHFYHVDLMGTDKKMINENQIIETLSRIVRKTSSIDYKGIGVLTSERRDVWAKAYQILIKDKTNKENLEDIQNSMIVVCLDRPIGIWKARNITRQRTVVGEQTMHGGGLRQNGCNRWYDKTLQFIASPDGLLGMSYEHSPADGQPVAVLVDFMIKFALENNTERPPSNGQIKPKRLVFKVPVELEPFLATAKVNLNRMVANLDLHCFQYTGYGKKFIKEQKLSPDAYIQMAVQYAFFSMYNVPGATYESGSTRMYEEGRTETIRTCSMDAVEFCKKMLDKEAGLDEKVKALRKAISSHKKYTAMALQGYGVDRHLLGLKLAAIEKGIKLHALYSHCSYKRSEHMRIATSQITFKSDAFMCYGPIVPDGYATCYNPRTFDIIFALSTFQIQPDTDSDMFKKSLERALVEMRYILVNTKGPEESETKKKPTERDRKK